MGDDGVRVPRSYRWKSYLTGPDSDCLLMEPLVVYFMSCDRLAGLRDASPVVPGTSK